MKHNINFRTSSSHVMNKPLGTNGLPGKKRLRQNSRHMYARFNVFSVLTPFDPLTAHKIDILIKQLLCQFEGFFIVLTSCKKSKIRKQLFQVISKHLDFWAKFDPLTPVPHLNEFLVN